MDTFFFHPILERYIMRRTRQIQFSVLIITYKNKHNIYIFLLKSSTRWIGIKMKISIVQKEKNNNKSIKISILRITRHHVRASRDN